MKTPQIKPAWATSIAGMREPVKLSTIRLPPFDGPKLSCAGCGLPLDPGEEAFGITKGTLWNSELYCSRHCASADLHEAWCEDLEPKKEESHVSETSTEPMPQEAQSSLFD